MEKVLKDLPEVEEIGGRHALAVEVEAARTRLLEALKNRAAEHPESPELTIAQARTAAALSHDLADALINRLSEKELRTSDSGLRLPQAGEARPELEAAAGNSSQSCAPPGWNHRRRNLVLRQNSS